MSHNTEHDKKMIISIMNNYLLDDLLMPALDGAVAAIEGDGIAVLIRQKLHLKVTGIGGKLHDEDWGAGDLGEEGSWYTAVECELRESSRSFRLIALITTDLAAYLPVCVLDIRQVIDHADALAPPAFRRLDHDGKADGRGARARLGRILDARVLEGRVRQSPGATVVLRLDVHPVPVDARHARVLRDDGAADLVPQSMHGRAVRADEADGGRGGAEGIGQGGLLGGVAPPSPDSVDGVEARKFHDEGNIGIVVVIGATWHVYDDVAHTDVLGVSPVIGGSCRGEDEATVGLRLRSQQHCSLHRDPLHQACSHERRDRAHQGRDRSPQIFGGRHDHEADGPLVREHLVRPPADAPDRLHGRHAVVGDQHLFDDAAICPAELRDIRRHIRETAVEVGIGHSAARRRERRHGCCFVGVVRRVGR